MGCRIKKVGEVGCTELEFGVNQSTRGDPDGWSSPLPNRKRIKGPVALCRCSMYEDRGIGIAILDLNGVSEPGQNENDWRKGDIGPSPVGIRSTVALGPKSVDSVILPCLIRHDLMLQKCSEMKLGDLS